MRRTAKEFLNDFRQRLIENQPPIDFKNPQKGFPGWWEDDTVQEMMDAYASEVLRDKEKDEIKFNQCLREEFLLNAQLYPHEYHDLFIKKYQRAQKRFGEYLKTK